MRHAISVTCQRGTPVTLQSTRTKRRIVRILTSWRYRGRWWLGDTTREYFMVECEGGAVFDIYREAEHWFATKRV